MKYNDLCLFINNQFGCRPELLADALFKKNVQLTLTCPLVECKLIIVVYMAKRSIRVCIVKIEVYLVNLSPVFDKAKL